MREFEFLCPTEVTLLTERREIPPYGLKGGQPGKCGRNELLLCNGKRKTLPSKTSFKVNPGEKIAIHTPGGGNIGK